MNKFDSLSSIEPNHGLCPNLILLLLFTYACNQFTGYGIGGNSNDCQRLLTEEVHEKVAEELTNRGATVNDLDKYGRTELHWAALQGQVEKVKEFLNSNDYDVNTQDVFGRTELHLAALEGQAEVVNLLLKISSIEINKPDNIYGRTALHFAAEQGHVEIVRALLKRGAKVNVPDKSNRTAITLAALEGRLAVIEALLNIKEILLNKEDKEKIARLKKSQPYGKSYLYSFGK